jgi:predicted acylesterase/phospholipase RssA
MKTTSLIVAAQLALANAQQLEECKALVMSGGGSNGAWEVGVLWGLTHYGDPADFAYDWITGVSAGAINTAALSGWPTGTEKEASEWLSYTMTTMTTADIRQSWPGVTLKQAFT